MDNDQRPTASRSTAAGVDPTTEIPWARTMTTPSVDAPAQAAAVEPGHAGYAAPPGSAPAVAPPVWSGKKTAIAAALAIGFASVGAVGAAAVLPAGSTSQTGPGGRGFPGGGQFQPGGGQFQPGQQNGQNQQGQLNQQGFPGQQNQQGFPGGQVPGAPGDDDDDHDDASTT